MLLGASQPCGINHGAESTLQKRLTCFLSHLWPNQKHTSPSATAPLRLTACVGPQVKIFGSYARWTFDMPPPSAAAPARMALTTIDAAHRHAVAPQPGPVHINVQLREPLSPVRQPWPPEVLHVAPQPLCGPCIVPLTYRSICHAWLGAERLQVCCYRPIESGLVTCRQCLA